jgi:hypothetical protein
MKMNPEIKAKWVEALRSGEYRQARRRLRLDDSAGPSYCCLGVLCELAGVAYIPAFSYLPDPVAESAGVIRGVQMTLADLNDGSPIDRPHTFAQIADYIEANL